MAKFKVGDKVQLTVAAVDQYENHEYGRYAFIRRWEWGTVYTGNLTIAKVYDATEYITDEGIMLIPLYELEEIDIGFYEDELERD